MKHHLFHPLIATCALVIAAGCKDNPDTPSPDPTNAINCIGHAHHGNDGGLTMESEATGIWSKSADTLSAKLTVAEKIGVSDTLFLQRGTQGWGYSSNDPRFNTGWTPGVTETKDSVTVSVSDGFVWKTYYLKKV